MRDLDAAVQQLDLRTWQQAAAEAAELRVRAEFAMGLRLTASGAKLADRLGLEVEPVSRRVWLKVAAAPPTASRIEQLITTRGLRGRAGLLARELTPPPQWMRKWQPVARRGRLGLAVAYLWRPFWLLFKLPSGIRAWRQAAHATRAQHCN